MDNCKSCGKEVIWLKHHETLKPNPIDAEPSINGNIVISREKGLYRMATRNEMEIARNDNKNLYISHFATCKDAKDHKKQ
jgi:hypothetical protein